MVFESKSLLKVLRLALVGVVLHCGVALADPQQDYAEGLKQSERGDIVAALPLFRKAAEAGHAGGQAAYAELLRQSDFSDEALEYFRLSAAQGDKDGQFGLAAMLASAEGPAQDVPEARRLFVLSAEQGHARAIEELAYSYLIGALHFTEEDRRSEQALYWIRKAAENGHIASMDAMANALRTGAFGLDIDAKAAKQWDEKVRKASGAKEQRRRRSRKNIVLEK